MLIKIILGKIKKNWLLILIFFLLTISVITLGSFYNQSKTRKTLNEFSNQLNTIAALKANQIRLWRQERIVDAQSIQTDQSFSKDIQLLLGDKTSLPLIWENQNRLKTLLRDPNYSSIFLADLEGNTVLHVGRVNEKPGDGFLDIILQTKDTQEITLTDLYVAFDGSVKMDLVVPIFISGEESHPTIGFLVYLITPEAILYPLLQASPTDYLSAETLLVRKEGDGVLYLNQLRFLDNSTLKLSIPLTNTEIPAVMAVNGITGIVKGKDYRGVSVMASIVEVEDTNWKLLAKLDQDEIYKPIEEQYWSTILASLGLLIAVSFIIYWGWRKSSAKIVKGLTESETERKKLEEKYSTLFDQANDAILLINDAGKIIDVNDQALKLYGYSRNELLNLSITDIREQGTKLQVLKDMTYVKNGTANFFETIHRKKNGEIFHVDVSSRYVSVGGEGFFQSLVRDVTEKKLAEEQLRLSELNLKKAQQVSRVGSWNWNLETNAVDWSDEMFHIFGIEKSTQRNELIEIMTTMFHPEDLDRVNQVFTNAIELNQVFSFETRILRKDRSTRELWIEAGELIFNNDHKVNAISGIVQDITEKKTAERELRKNENLLQKIYELLPVGLWITDASGKLIRSNKAIAEIWGKDVLNGMDELSVLRGRRLPSGEQIKPNDWAFIHTLKEGLTIQDEMIEIDAYDGKTKTILNYSTPIIDENGELEGALILNLDISELKNAEKKLSDQLDELRRWNLATLGRENRIRELKSEINELLKKQGLPPKYQSVTGDGHE